MKEKREREEERERERKCRKELSNKKYILCGLGEVLFQMIIIYCVLFVVAVKHTALQ
jgi:hypothetical protein